MQEETKKDSKEVPHGPRGMRIPTENVKFNKNTFIRVLGYMKRYKWQYIIVFICIIISSLASVASQVFIKSLIDDYITPLIGVENPVYTKTLRVEPDEKGSSNIIF